MNNEPKVTPFRGRTPSPAEFKQNGSTLSYTVRQGDTLGKIAQSLRQKGINISYREIARQNNIANADRILVGQEITINIEGHKLRAERQQPQRPANRPASAPAKQNMSPVYSQNNSNACVSHAYDLYDPSNTEVSRMSTPGNNAPARVARQPNDKATVSENAVIDIVDYCRANPANAHNYANDLTIEGIAAIGGNNIDRALQVADILSNIPASDARLFEAYSEIYTAAGESLMRGGNYSRARDVFNRVADTAKHVAGSKEVFYKGQIQVQGRGVTIAASGGREAPLYVEGHEIANTLTISVAEAARVRARQCDFMARAGGRVKDPFNFGQVRDHLLSLPADRIGSNLELYFKAFYFHPHSDVSDQLSASRVRTFPSDRLGRKPADCYMFAKIAREVLSPSLLSFGRSASFQTVVASKTFSNGTMSNTAHAMLAISLRINGSEYKFLLNNDSVIDMRNGGIEEVGSLFAKWLKSKGYDVANGDRDSLPYTHIAFVDNSRNRLASISLAGIH